MPTAANVFVYLSFTDPAAAAFLAAAGAEFFAVLMAAIRFLPDAEFLGVPVRGALSSWSPIATQLPPAAAADPASALPTAAGSECTLRYEGGGPHTRRMSGIANRTR